jgi:hypothetical protein
LAIYVDIVASIISLQALLDIYGLDHKKLRFFHNALGQAQPQSGQHPLCIRSQKSTTALSGGSTLRRVCELPLINQQDSVAPPDNSCEGGSGWTGSDYSYVIHGNSSCPPIFFSPLFEPLAVSALGGEEYCIAHFLRTEMTERIELPPA